VQQIVVPSGFSRTFAAGLDKVSSPILCLESFTDGSRDVEDAPRAPTYP
jgi:hypothetical protein